MSAFHAKRTFQGLCFGDDNFSVRAPESGEFMNACFDDEAVVSMDNFCAGMHFPQCPEMLELLTFFGLVPVQLMLNSHDEELVKVKADLLARTEEFAKVKADLLANTEELQETRANLDGFLQSDKQTNLLANKFQEDMQFTVDTLICGLELHFAFASTDEVLALAKDSSVEDMEIDLSPSGGSGSGSGSGGSNSSCSSSSSSSSSGGESSMLLVRNV